MEIQRASVPAPPTGKVVQVDDRQTSGGVPRNEKTMTNGKGIKAKHRCGKEGHVVGPVCEGVVGRVDEIRTSLKSPSF